ncbi:family 20 glycosylhydrolase [Enterococcus sp. DIV0197]|uniref:family 20 glycosylhydrolase n=1 Tax=unclassified Enterococcus TaxID=2608891 RepID=UPI003D2CF517
MTKLTDSLPISTERGLSIDIGRKFYSPNFLKDLLDYMASLKMNALQLHFSDNEGFRIECETVPALTSSHYLSKIEIKELIAYAKQLGIEIIPEFDSPGHLKRLLSIYPEWQMERLGEDSDVFPSNRAIDITNQLAVNKIKEIIKEYLELFHDSHYFHLGADEYISFDELDRYPQLARKAEEIYQNPDRTYDLFIDYINDLATLVESTGKTARIWNDGVYKKNQKAESGLKKSIQITYWTNYNAQMADVQTFFEEGHQVLNFNDNYFYFVLGEGAGYRYPTGDKIKKEWKPTIFSGNQQITEEQLTKVPGIYFAIWCDFPDALTEEEVLQMIKEPLKVQQTMLWNDQLATK